MREEFYLEADGQTYAAPQYGYEIRVKVGADLKEENAVAMSKEAMEELGIQEGDIVEIYGAWIQEAKAVLSKEKDMTLVQMSQKIREALPCSPDQYVGIRRKYEA